MVEKNSCVAVYDNHLQAEEAVRRLLEKGFDAGKLSIVGKGYQREEHPIGFYNTGDRMKFWGAQGAFWGGLWGMLLGAAFFWVPGLGTVVIAGPLVSALVTALEGAAVMGGLSVLGAALYSIGIPRDSIVRYETAIKSDHYLLIVHGDQGEVERAHDVLAGGDARDVTIHLS
ncbi:MAG TPA: permease [Gammaproteobacteria bacterium]|nr:permease [Gammaproteobacteria bacterium]